jgi:hypothetical protein
MTMPEKEYIERGAVLRHIFDQIEEHGDPDPIDAPVARGSLMGLKYAHSVVSVLPAADVVEVVRCKDCKHYKEYLDISTKEPTGWGKCECIAMDIDIMRNDFCSYGERKEK